MLFRNFSKLRQTTEVIYSDPLIAHGLTWRLKVYPNGTYPIAESVM